MHDPLVKQSWRHPVGIWLILSCLTILAMIPVLAAQYPPLNDYPFHYARLQVLVASGTVFQDFYAPGSWLLPNIAMDAFAVLADHILPDQLLLRVFTALTIVLQISGLFALFLQLHGRITLWAAVPSLAVFNGILTFGFLNYLFGISLAIWGLAAWLRWRHKRLTVLALFPVALILMLCHMEAFGVFAVCVATLECFYAVQSARRGEQFASSLLRSVPELAFKASPFVAAVLLFFLLSPTSDDAGSLEWATDYLPAFIFGPLYAIAGPHKPTDGLVYGLVILFIGLSSVSRKMLVHGAMLTTAVLIGLLSVLLPKYALGSDFVNVRLAPVAVMLALVSFNPSVPGPSRSVLRKFALLCAVSLALLLPARLASISVLWHQQSSQIASIVEDFAGLKPGAVVFAALQGSGTMLLPGTAVQKAAWKPPLKHVTSFALEASPVFVPMTYLDPNKQPLRLTEQAGPIKEFQTHSPRRLANQKALSSMVEDICALKALNPFMKRRDIYLSVVGSGTALSIKPLAGSDVIASSSSHLLLALTSICEDS